MSDHALLVLVLIGSTITFVIMLLLIFRTGARNEQRAQVTLQEQLRSGRVEAAAAARDQRTELQTALKALTESTLSGIRELREAYVAASAENRQTLGTFSASQESRLQQLGESVVAATRASAESSDKLRDSLAASVKELQGGNEKKLDEMRATVDEKLQGTLEKRLGESFALMSDRLEAVQRGLGEMQALATGVGDLKKVLSNVKTRGTFGELQLRAILEQILSPDQYRENFAPRIESGDRVEFAIVLPGRDPAAGQVFLPVDSKFPQEEFLRLIDAAERNDAEGMAEARTKLMRQVRAYARYVAEKYVCPPMTTDFAIVFLPTEGLYAEVLRQPGLVEDLQGSFNICIAGPTTFAAFLNSLRMGFRTLAIEQRSSEVWQTLAAVKTEFGRFGQVLDKVQKQLGSASRTLDETGRRTRAMERKLRQVEELPADLAARVIGLARGELPESPSDDDDEERAREERGVTA